MMDDRVHTAEDAERAVGLPILGRVPAFPRRSPSLIAAKSESAAKESYRRLRAGISFASEAETVRSLMVTSAVQGEGKSTTAANLALAAAFQGRRVILVDADLREPSLDRRFGVGEQPGLSDVLVNGVEPTSALHRTDVPGLLLMPAGSPVPDAPELLAGPAMGQLIRELSGQADLVILDSPPCLPVADPAVLGSRVDAALLVVGIGSVNRQAVRMARELLEQAHVRLLGAVVNRLDPGDQGRDYHYRYGASGRTSVPGLRGGTKAALLQPSEAHEDEPFALEEDTA
jgi:capsular exopolysaccharide synthesis family protein